ncbi:MAG: hypothetical protein HC884_19610 [Chloroflexaceae bacterium]|nr:hypothetical protein [Chloroflexaceae bacterium]
MHQSQNQGHRPAVWTGLLLLGVYLLTTGGQTFISDGEIMLLTAVRLVDAQTLRLPESATAFPQVVRGYDGTLVSCYGLGQPLLAAVLYWVGRYLVGWYLLPGGDDFHLGKFFALLLPALATALTGRVLCAWATRLYRSSRLGVVLGLLYGLGTLAWPYSRFFFSEPLFTACLVLAAFALFQRRPLRAGLFYGYAVVTRIGGVVLLPAFLLYAWFHAHPQERLRRIAWMGVGGLPGGLLVLFHNWVRFRTLTEAGYPGQGFTGNLLEGLYGLLLSPGKSIFLYVPLLLALPAAVVPFIRQFRPEALLVGALTLITLIESAMWWMWWGGWGWGPRFLTPLMPFLVLSLGSLLRRRPWQYLIVGMLLPLSLMVNMMGILVDFNVYIREVTGGISTREMIYLFQPEYSPILGHLRYLDLKTIPIVSLDLHQQHTGFPEPAATFVSACLVLLTAGSLVGLWRAVKPVPDDA